VFFFLLPTAHSRLPMIENPWFYALAVPAVLMTGISKGGFAGGIGLLAVPMMATRR